ncbi:uncharacterized protein LOC124493498 [Dermatophagoides farinae]|uniref:Deltamethrin resistance protein prag01 domain-containing protein n=2 Tax=Dermatophagoides farinae TaxID=6954 RepID=A0A922HP08_DERFA|nr:uncharacterized protein LOC124493498 [Dermatophagoides farinae]KAH9497103.1 hypothetical protein DERF_013112 [Dermatophagoides farinae]
MMSFGASRLLSRLRIVRASRRNMSSHDVPEQYRHWVRPNMDNGYPVPSQLYSEAYAARQAKYNKMLGLSVLFLLSAMGFCSMNGTFEFLSPPPRKVNIPLDKLQ